MTRLRDLAVAAAAMLNDAGGPWGGRSGGGSGGGGGSNGGGSGGGGSSGGGGGSGGNGGGGGNGPRNPWSQPPEGGRPRPKGPTALDELLKRARTGGSGGRGGGGFAFANQPRLWAYAAAGFVALWLVFTSFHQIDPAEQGVVTRFGRYVKTVGPGVSMTLPAPFDRMQKINTQNVRVTNIPEGTGERLVLTHDQNLIDLDYAVRWTIREPELYLFQAVDTDSTVRSVAESAMRAAIANVSLSDAIGAGRGAIESEVTTNMQRLLDQYRVGVHIQGVAIKQTDPPAAVIDAFKEVSAAQQTAQTTVNQSRAYAAQIVARAQGDATAFDRVYVQYKAAPEVTRRRMYYETMERVLSKVDKTVVEVPGGVTPYLPLPQGRRSALPVPAAAAPAAAASPATTGDGTAETPAQGAGQ